MSGSRVLSFDGGNNRLIFAGRLDCSRLLRMISRRPYVLERRPLSVLDGVPMAVKDDTDQLPYETTNGTTFTSKL